MNWKRRAMDEHRVPMLGGAWRRHSDPRRSADPRVRQVIGALAGLPVAPDPRPEFRAELRAQLVAVAPRLVAEGEPAAAPAPRAPASAPKPGTAQPTARRRVRIVKPLVAAACVLTAFVLLLGGAVLISQHALPGDALYGIKRASENTEYSLAGGAVDRGKLKLDFAARRIGEVGDLLPRASAMTGATGATAGGSGLNSTTAGLVRDTLGSANGDIQTAAQLLGGAAVRSGDRAPLAAITSWTPGQITAMRSIIARLPAGSLHSAAEQTLGWLRAAQQRATRLGAQLGCSCLTAGTSDVLGPRPCTGPCSATTPAGRTHQTKPRAPGRNRHPSAHPVAPGVTRPAAGSSAASGPARTPVSTAPHPRRSAPAGSSSTLPAPPGKLTTPAVPLPSVPGLGGGGSAGTGSTGLPLPVRVSSSCVQLSAGPIQIGVGSC